MTGPLSEEERRAGARRVGVGFVVVVAVSAGLTALHAGGGPAEVGIVALAGLLVGGVVLLTLTRQL